MPDFPTLKIGNLEINPPIIQGGMGVRISLSSLAAAVANQGGVGVIATAGIGGMAREGGKTYAQLNQEQLTAELKKARSQTKGLIGVNIMVALADYDQLAKTAVEQGADILISGAGLPLNLPAHAGDRDVKLIPIVSSARALSIIAKKWKNNYNRLPDAVIVEGPMAGGHLGYDFNEALGNKARSLDDSLREIIPVAASFAKPIPVIAAGGIFDGADIARVLKLGANGVQMATRFVCTDECDVHPNFKQMYLNARKEDITLIHSPVGLPGRVVQNEFVKKINNGHKVPFKCKYQCLRSCDYKNAPYCIAEVLHQASLGNLENAFAFAGSNVYKCHEIVSVEKLMQQLRQEYIQANNQ
ncbi:MAG: nitronate monooxygenase [Sedimentisphaerales bacterium]|nr:nitronate monooxygenase [Sedimentisphaerales bacterium]MBN2843542.1 nitronate monooxygenase [Sedimentisphaerales bacterium]